MNANSHRFGIACVLVLLAAGAVAAQTTDTVRVTVARANVRAEPSEKGAVLTQVTAGTELELRSVAGDWYKVRVMSGPTRFEAYISKKVATLVKPGSAPAGARSGPPAPAASRARAAVPPSPASRPAAATARLGMTASVEVDGAPRYLAPGTARLVQLADRADSARAAAIAMPVGRGKPLPASASAQITYVWLIDQADSSKAPAIGAPRPEFVVRFRDVPGVSPDDFAPAVVRLVGTAGGPRVMGALRGRVDQASRAQADWDVARGLKQEIVKASSVQSERGVVRLVPSADLEPGEYAIVLRPTGNKKFAGASVLSESEEGRVFGILWPFVVK